MDTFAALALATDPPSLELLDRKPEPRGASIISFDMWKMIFGQAILQLVVTFVLNFAGTEIFTGWDAVAMQTVVFNTFVWLQIFNEFNCRRIDQKLNVFSGIQRNPYFIAITLIMVGGQILIIFVGGAAFSVTRLDGPQWATSIILGLLSLPFGVIIRLIPNQFVRIFIPHRLLQPRKKTTFVDEEKLGEGWDPALEDLRDDLVFIKKLRSRRRLGSLGGPTKAIRKLIPSSNKEERRPSTPVPPSTGSPSPSPSPSPSDRRARSRSNSAFKPATMLPGIVAGSMFMSPTSPSDSRGQGFFAGPMSREDIERVEGVELHKDTDPNDPIVGAKAASFDPLRSAMDDNEKSESKRHWRGRLSVHSRATSRSSISSSAGGPLSPGGLTAPRRDVSRESRTSSKSGDEGKGKN
jgi:P-type Ca2+ transporter type 2C